MRIDIHHHIVPPRYFEVTRERILKTTPRPEVVLQWTPERSIETMDAAGVSVGFTSVSVPGLWFGDLAQTQRLATLCNDYAADLVARHPKRFRMFAMLPLPDVEATLREIARAYDDLRADGVCLFTNYGDSWPNDPRYAPVLEELDRRNAVVFVHPIAPQACAWMAGLRPSAVEYLFDTVRCMTGLIFSGVARRRPNIRWIFCHAGGALAPMFERIVRQGAHTQEVREILPEGPLPYFQKFYYDIATSASPDNLGVLLRHVPASQILFGLDMPFVSASSTLAQYDACAYAPPEREAFESGNARRLFPSLAAI
jgi:6-methylsalicylate decarboxylase